MKAPLLATLGLLLPLNTAWAQSFAVTSLNPARNAVAASRNAGLSLTLTQPMGAAGTAALRVFSSQRGGLLTGTTAGSGSTFSFYPVRAFRPGETLRATLTTAAQSSSGAALAVPQVWQFTAAAQGGTGQFGGGTEVAVGALPTGVAAADVDNDGDVDLLTANADANTVSVRFNNGQGSFSGTTDVAVDRGPTNLALADVDADGDLDLLTANYGGGLIGPANTVSLRLNNGAGGFGGGSDIAVSNNPNNLEIGDVDADGDLDLLVTRGWGQVSVLLNAGNGTFTTASQGVGLASSEATLADVDADGDLDLVSVDSWGARQVLVDLNNGQGSFTRGSALALSSSPNSLALADLDADGDLDLVAANGGATPSSISVRLNNGLGTFGGTTELGTGLGVSTVALADVNGDGRPDVLATDYASNATRVYLNTGAGAFGSPASVAVGSGPREVVTADVDNDGDLDMLVGNMAANTVSVRLNNGTGAPLTTQRGAAAAALAVYPNPAHDQVKVQVPTGTREVVLRNALGQYVRTVTVAPGRDAVLTLQGLPAGIYQVQAGAATGRLVVE